MSAKNKIVAELFESKEFNDCINKMEPEHLRDDLKAEVMLILLETDDEKLKGLHKKNELKFYTVRIILNLIQSKTSPFYKKYRMSTSVFSEPCSPCVVETIEPEGFDDRLKRELRNERAIQIIDTLYWYDKTIVNLYLELGSYRAIEKDTGIPWESCYSTIRKVIKQIRNELKPV